MTTEGERSHEIAQRLRKSFLKTRNGRVNIVSNGIPESTNKQGGYDSGGHVISRLLLSCDRISIKLQLTGKSRLISCDYRLPSEESMSEIPLI